MTETKPPVLRLIRDLAGIDVLVSKNLVRIKDLKLELEKRANFLSAEEQRAKEHQRLLSDKKALLKKQESALTAERAKLTERRKALESLNNYKVQQAGEREISSSAREISAKEELLIADITLIDQLEQQFKEIISAGQKLFSEFNTFKIEAANDISELEKRLAEYQVEREAAANQVADAAALTLYKRALEKYPYDPIVVVKGGISCAGCFMQIGPQQKVQISRGEVIRCPGCSRILCPE